MLQQTTVAAVRPRFEQWMRRFPDPAALAVAAEGEVMRMWEGLGYYRRASNLQRAACGIVARHGGEVPSDRAALEALPGVGSYTASAVLAFAFNRPVVVLDANIERVVARLVNFRGRIDQPAGKARLHEIAGALWPKRIGGRAFASAMMDLGATVCRAGEPACGLCVVREFCRAVEPRLLPVKRARPVVTSIEEQRALHLRGGSVALVRCSGPRWQGLWVLPEAKSKGRELASLVYPITRYRVRMVLVRAARQPKGSTFFPLDQLPGMPTPHRRALHAALANGADGANGASCRPASVGAY